MVRHGPDGSDLQTANSPEAAEIKKKTHERNIM